VENPAAREHGTSISIGLRPDSLVLGRVRRELRAALTAWTGEPR
jgi:hypothetical protein